MQRRTFLTLMGLAPFAYLSPDIAFAQTARGDYRKLLVLVELKGGNDGLNTVIPYADNEYRRLRPQIGIARDAVLQLSDTAGLHPSLEPLLPLWRERELAIVQGVGYPQPNLSHFRSIEIWDTASRSEQYLNDGWLARSFARAPVPASFAADAAIVGGQELGPATGSRAIVISNLDQFRRRAGYMPTHRSASANPALRHLLKVEADIAHAGSALKGDHVFKTEFPRHVFGNAVKTAAEIIAGSGAVAAVKLSLGGFDTHGGQPDLHARLLKELAEGLAALKAALTEIDRWRDTLIVTYSEFGRRPQENQSRGTDHGTAAAHFALGGSVRGGLYGDAPSLSRLEGGNLRFAVDFRSVYATILQRWWGLDGSAILGGRFETVNILRGKSG